MIFCFGYQEIKHTPKANTAKVKKKQHKNFYRSDRSKQIKMMKPLHKPEFRIGINFNDVWYRMREILERRALTCEGVVAATHQPY